MAVKEEEAEEGEEAEEEEDDDTMSEKEEGVPETLRGDCCRCCGCCLWRCCWCCWWWWWWWRCCWCCAWCALWARCGGCSSKCSYAKTKRRHGCQAPASLTLHTYYAFSTYRWGGGGGEGCGRVVSGASQDLGKHDMLRVKEHDGWVERFRSSSQVKRRRPVFVWWPVCELSVWVVREERGVWRGGGD